MVKMTKLESTHCSARDAQAIVRILEFHLEVREKVYLSPLSDPKRWSMVVCKDDRKKLFAMAKRAVNRVTGESKKNGTTNFGIQVSNVPHTHYLEK